MLYEVAYTLHGKSHTEQGTHATIRYLAYWLTRTYRIRVEVNRAGYRTERSPIR